MQTICTAAASAVLQAFRDNNIYLVLIDLEETEGSAHRLCSKIRESSACPIILLSYNASRENQVQSLKIGADDFVAKPCDLRLLLARVITLLRRTYRYNGNSSAAHQSAGVNPADRFHLANRVQTTVGIHATSPVNQSLADSLPPNWASCNACKYLGPTMKFEGRDSMGQIIMKCPHCQSPANLTYTLN